MKNNLKANKRIMIVDDDQELLSELQEALNLNGYETVVSDNAIKAPEIAKDAKPDLILLDLKMPGKSGFALADELKKLSIVGGVPIIAISGCFEDQYAMLMNICGIKKCLKKPLDIFEVMFQIEEELKKAREKRPKGIFEDMSEKVQ